jgi:protein phosphatase
MLQDADIASILLEDVELEGMATRLIEAANANGGRDNISVLLVRAQAVVRKPGLIARFLGK